MGFVIFSTRCDLAIQFSAADNDLKALYGTIENNIDSIREFLEKSGIAAEDISLMSSDITDNSANHYGSSSRPEFRYTALQTITIYSSHIEAVRSVMGNLSDLGREGILFTDGYYGLQPEYLFTRLNDVKPEMIEEATRKAREVAESLPRIRKVNWVKSRELPRGSFRTVTVTGITRTSRESGWLQPLSIIFPIDDDRRLSA